MGSGALGYRFVSSEIDTSGAVSFMIETEDQADTDRYWNAIVGNGSKENYCGWCQDRWGFSWQITPRTY